MTDGSVQAVLRAEYALLCMGHVFKQEFDKYVQEHGITTIPSKFCSSTSKIRYADTTLTCDRVLL